MHIGNCIREKLKKDGRSAAWLAGRICCTRTHVYKIFKKESIDTALLVRISHALDYDFFEEISNELANVDDDEEHLAGF